MPDVGYAFDRVGMLARLARDLPTYFRRPITVQRAEQIVRWRLETRTDRFLRGVERVVYGHRPSPYRRLLLAAGCELGDLRRLVEQEGLEGALEQLAGRGVYVSFDEFKGRREI